MIKNIEKEGNILFVNVSDMITKEDVEIVVPTVKEMIAEHQKIKSLIVITELKGYTIEGFLADLSFYFKHKNAFEYVAVVGDKEFEKTVTEFFDNFFPGKAKYFDISNLKQAKDWIRMM